MKIYAHHVIAFGPGRLAEVTGHLVEVGRCRVREHGGEIFWERSRYWQRTPGAETANRNLGARYGMTLDSAVSILEPIVSLGG